jgi:hypothetical protein
LHINLLENMKGRTISDLFDFLKWLHRLDGVLIFYNKQSKEKMISAFYLRAIFLPRF